MCTLPPMVSVRRLSADAARRIALAAQGFDRPRPTGAITRRHLRRVVDTVGVIQIDSVNVLVRSQEMPLFARLGPHPRSLIPAAVAAGDLFEYWSHAASLLRTEDHHLYRWRMAKARAGGGSGGLAQRKQHVVDDVLRQLEAPGPAHRRRHRGAGADEGRHLVGLGRDQARPRVAVRDRPGHRHPPSP